MQTTIVKPKTRVIQPAGHVNASNVAELQHQIKTALTEHKSTTVLVNLEQVESIDSAGLMALVYGLRLAQAQNQRFSICNVSPSIRIIFELTQLDTVFEIFESQAKFEAAIA